jgi:nucleoside-diphosphate-sugar epimerase
MIEKLSDEKILLTGGTGFIGRYVVERLILEGNRPTVLTRNSKIANTEKSARNINFVEIDLLDTHSLKNFLDNFRPDIIIHLAGNNNKGNNQSEILTKFNFEATSKLLELARNLAVKRIIITGTADEYGFQPCPQRETMAAMPVSEYAISKNKAVNYAVLLSEKCNLPAVVLRPFTIYGDGQPAKMFVSQAVKSAVKGIPFEMSKGRQKRDLLFVRDFVDAIMKALTVENIEGEVFNVGSGQAIALEDLAKKIWKIAGADERLLKIGARLTEQNELHDTQADISKIKAAFGWEPKISLDEGLIFIIEKTKNELK